MPYMSKVPQVASLQLKVQELALSILDTNVVTTSASTATVDVKENIDSIRSCIFIDDSAGTAAPVAAASRVVSGSTVVLTLSAPLAASDCIVLKYVTTK